VVSEYCNFHGAILNTPNGVAIELTSSTSLRLVRCFFDFCRSTDYGGAVYFTAGTFEAAGCCASYCDSSYGLAFYLQSHDSGSAAKLSFCSFLKCSHTTSIAVTGAVAGEAVPLDCDHVNFRQCSTRVEGSAISIKNNNHCFVLFLLRAVETLVAQRLILVIITRTVMKAKLRSKTRGSLTTKLLLELSIRTVVI
jgi:hypothetical protein